jgi:hypothetical protein
MEVEVMKATVHVHQAEMRKGNPAMIETSEPCELGGLPAHRVTFKSLSSHKRSAIYVDGCKSCDYEKSVGETYFPSHFAGSRCESQSRNHCTCSICY